MFSVTAPGADLYPFDPRWCSHSPSKRCSGRIGCRVDPEVARAFNQRVSPWWSELHRVAKQRADRATGFKGTIAARVWEKQKRGLAHMHGVLSVSTPAELAWAEAYVAALCDLAPSKGFGFVDGWEKIRHKMKPGVEAAAYLSAYLVMGKGRKASLTENVQDRSVDLAFLNTRHEPDASVALGPINELTVYRELLEVGFWRIHETEPAFDLVPLLVALVGE